MNNNLYTIASLVLSITLSSTLFAQSTGKIKKGGKYYEGYSYTKAIEKYESLSEKDTETKRKLAESYLKIGDTDKSESYYTEVVAAADKTKEDIYAYASVLSMNGKHAESEKWMKQYADLEKNDTRGQQYKNRPGLYKTLQQDKGRFTVTNLDVNSKEQDFGPSYYKNQLVFASSRHGVPLIKRTWNWNGLSYLDLYVSKINDDNQLDSPDQFNKKVNAKYHEGPVSFNDSATYMVFTRNNYQGKSEEGIVKLQLFESTLENGKWSKAKPLPYNSDEYSVGHASLTPDGKTIYFASDMPGGVGGVDLYTATKNADGTWSQAKNLGTKVNTEGNEMFPFIHPEQEMLFFASNGHIGLGGLDVFITQVKKDNTYGKVENVGTPVNSTKDDFSLILDKEKQSGYFASNREEGKGDDDIYSYQLLKPFNFGKTLKGVAKDKKGEILSAVEVILYDGEGKELEKTTTDQEGNYSFSVEPDKNYNLSGNKVDYFEGKNSASSKTEEEVIYANLELEKDPGLSLYAVVTDKKTGKPLEGVTMKIIDNLTGDEKVVTTPKTGDYRRALSDKKLQDRGSYNFVLQKEGYFSKTVTYNTLFDKEGQYDVHSNLDLTLDLLVKDLAQLIEINPINFDYNKYAIRKDAAVELDKIVSIMNKYPNMVVELGSHTDARGSDAYNRKLSDRRAKASAAYIKKHISLR